MAGIKRNVVLFSAQTVGYPMESPEIGHGQPGHAVKVLKLHQMLLSSLQSLVDGYCYPCKTSSVCPLQFFHHIGRLALRP